MCVGGHGRGRKQELVTSLYFFVLCAGNIVRGGDCTAKHGVQSTECSP